jgi:DNA-binding NtrC family response regulator
LQSKILRVLQEGEFSRVGGSATLKSDVRIIAATNRNLEQDVAEKKFREDLFYRLNVVRVQLPPLRQRLEDIRLLAEYFLQKVATRMRLPRLKLSEDAMKVLEGHNWPGNVRELENTIQRACVLSTSDVLLPKDIPLGMAPLPSDADPVILVQSNREHPSLAGVVTKEMAIDSLLRVAQADPTIQLLPWLEREFTIHSMRATGGNQVRAAKLLGITRATLRKRMEIFGITKELNISG